LRPKSESISRRHCALVQKDGRLLLVDLKSRNGTFINEKQLSPDKAKILKSGDRIRVGQLEFEISIEVGLANAKKSEVSTVKEAVDRLAEQKTSDSRESFDISSWLLEADQIDRRKTMAEPETRHMNVDETTRLDAEQEIQSDASELSGSDKISDSASDSGSDGGKLKRPEKKPPMKLPKVTQGPTTKNTKDAASETLKKYFGGR
jgi:pSer/pThr/pTyr-binding forkhead associated (FHA) protein